MARSLVRISIDRGGTFTDIHAIDDDQEFILKLLSVDPNNYPDAPTEGIRRVLERISGQSIPKSQKLNLDMVESVRMGTTVATNALLERQGERCALLTTRGFRDVIRIGKQARPNIFDLTVSKLSFLYETVVEIDERVTIDSFDEDPFPYKYDAARTDLVKGLTGEWIKVIKAPVESEVKAQLQTLYDQGFGSIALALLHSYTFTAHEDLIAKIAREMGFSVSVSHELQPMIKIVARANSSVADAYLTPITRRYIEGFSNGFEGGLAAFGNKLLFMQSDGGLCNWNDFSGLHAILSGPAGGVIGFSKTCYEEGQGNLIALDMGGTSTDVSRYAGELEHVFETTTAEVIIQAPQLDINTVAAGGGSRLFWENKMFVVGPESAGAHPGPACYRKGGPLAVTDANLMLGRLLPEHFPKIFGPNEDESLDESATAKAFEEIALAINSEKEGEKLTLEEIASGFIQVANEAMCRPIRTLTEARGFESAAHNLVIFGGAGGQHGASIAKSLGISRVIIPRFSSILSAYGMALADIVHEVSEASALTITDDTVSHLLARSEAMKAGASQALTEQGIYQKNILLETFFNCRYQGSSTNIMIPQTNGGDIKAAFIEKHQSLFGFTLHERAVHVDDIRVRATGVSPSKVSQSLYAELKASTLTPAVLSGLKAKKVYYDGLGWLNTVLVPLETLSSGQQVSGPAIIYDATQTILVEPTFIATALSQHVVMDRVVTEKIVKSVLDIAHVNPVQLSVFGHRFMSIAEQMGTILRQTSISVNIKERLDFSCALFSPFGDLVANAPHMPCHLGAMSYAVRYQAQLWKDKVVPGDVFVSNHPIAGGSHLPDITVMTPAFYNGEIVFWTACRAHHADIGGLRAGSMPPFSKEIYQEGAQIVSFKLVKGGVFDEEGITKILFEDPGKYPDCSGTRTLKDNISDLKAQVASNNRGLVLIDALCKEFSIPTVQFYMKAIQDTAEQSVRDLLRRVHKMFEGAPLQAVDYMDAGAELHLKITIDPVTGDGTFDYTGTSPQLYNNLNAPTAIVYSAILYALRSLLNTPIPLNHGCLAPIKVVVPDGTFISPTPDAATVAGNVETSQRLTDVVFKAFEACGASQGTCNNLTYGYGKLSQDGSRFEGFGYYETIGGGSGAGASWHGQSATHVHMSNTAIGDPEVTERKYPMIIDEYSIREGSGGKGRFNGGNGCLRRIQFTENVEAAIIAERRSVAPYGMRGGEPGAKGKAYWIRTRNGNTARIELGGSNEMSMMAGDYIEIHTPGGGGYGIPGSAQDDSKLYLTTSTNAPPTRGNGSVAEYLETQNTN